MDRHRIMIDRAEVTAARLVAALRAAGLRPGHPVITSDGRGDIGFDVQVGLRGTLGATYVRAMAGAAQLTGGEPYRVLDVADDWSQLDGIVAAALAEQQTAKPKPPRPADPYGYDSKGAYHGD